MSLLLRIDGSGGTLHQPVRLGQRLTVGRAPTCSIRLEDKVVSSEHLTLTIRDQYLEVLDASRNGTLVGGKRVLNALAVAPLGTAISLGATTLWLLDESQSTAPPSHPPAAPPPAPAVPSVSPPWPEPDAPAEGARAETVPLELRREMHRQLLNHLDLTGGDTSALAPEVLRPRVLQALRQILGNFGQRLPAQLDANKLVGELADEALGLGPLEALLADPSVSEIMVLDSATIFVERAGQCVLSDASFTDESRVRAAIERIATPLGRRIDESSPLLDARLADGSRVNAVIKPLALRGTCITIRKFPKKRLDLSGLEAFGTLTTRMGRFLSRAVKAKKNIVVAGGTGSGKTTLLNVLSSAIPEHERIITIEDSAELQLPQAHVVSLETKPANLEDKGAYTIRDLVKNALRMRPDRIVIGECRGGEALDMLQAMNTGHEGSLTTVHANSPREALSRLETLCLMSGLELPARAIREQIASSVHLLVQQQRLQDGSRKITSITEVAGMDLQGRIRFRELFSFVQTGTSAEGRSLGDFRASGYLPSFMHEFVTLGLIEPGEPFL